VCVCVCVCVCVFVCVCVCNYWLLEGNNELTKPPPIERSLAAPP